jgi:hypothetical protein
MLVVIRLSAALLILFIGTLSRPAWAQSSTNGVMVFGQASPVQLWDDEGSIGTGLGIGGGVNLPLSDSWNLRGRVIRSQNERNFGNGVVFENSSTRYAAELLWELGDSRYAPYFGAGVGAFSFDHRTEFGPDPRAPVQRPTAVQRFSSSGTELMYGGIAGITAVSAGRFRLQPEFSMWLSQGWFVQMEYAVVAGWQW